MCHDNSTDGTFISNITIEVVSMIHVRSPVTITCTVMLTGTTIIGMVDVSWSKDGIQLRNSSELVITSSYATTTLYHSNLTILVLETSDRGLYTCRAHLSQSTPAPTLPSVASTVHLAVEGIIECRCLQVWAYQGNTMGC